MGLRLAEGVDLERLGSDAVDDAAVARLRAHGLLELHGARLRTTAAGRLLLDSILAEIVAG